VQNRWLAAAAFGEIIIPARSESCASSVASGRLSFNVTVWGSDDLDAIHRSEFAAASRIRKRACPVEIIFDGSGVERAAIMELSRRIAA